MSPSRFQRPWRAMPSNQYSDLLIASTSRTFEAWRKVLDSFDAVVVGRNAKGASLVELERWWLDLGVSKNFGRDELIRLIQWKGTRGKFRPALVRYAKDMDDKALRTAVAEARKTLLQDSSMYLDENILKQALSPLLNLRGIGPATASAILAAFDDRIPFMGDSLLEGLHDGNRQYTLPSYLSLFDKMKAIQKSVARISDDGSWMSLRDMERAVFVDTLGQPVGLHSDGAKRRASSDSKNPTRALARKRTTAQPKGTKEKKQAR